MPIEMTKQARNKVAKLAAAHLVKMIIQANPDKSRDEVFAIIDALRAGVIADEVEGHFLAEHCLGRDGRAA
jgi:hypothetical protein